MWLREETTGGLGQHRNEHFKKDTILTPKAKKKE
jgi:hypothetical protein